MLRVQSALLFAALVGLAYGEGKCKHHQNDNPNPSGNPIGKPEAGQKVLAGEPFEITWSATGSNPISLVLLRGPRDNAVEFLCIADAVENSGSYSWTPPDTLQGDPSNYGLKIIDDESGDYQYSPLFGIKNPKNPYKKKKEENKEKKKEEKKEEKSSKTEAEHKTKTCTKEHCAHPTKEAKKGHLKHHGAGSVKHHGGYNHTMPYPTGTSYKKHKTHSKTKTKSKSKTKSKHQSYKSKEKAETSTSTQIDTATATLSGANPGQVTSMVVASGPGVAAEPPPTVTANAGGTSSTPSTFNNAGPTRGVSGGMLAGACALAALVL